MAAPLQGAGAHQRGDLTVPSHAPPVLTLFAGAPWSDEEHKAFLAGLKMYGRVRISCFLHSCGSPQAGSRNSAGAPGHCRAPALLLHHLSACLTTPFLLSTATKTMPTPAGAVEADFSLLRALPHAHPGRLPRPKALPSPVGRPEAALPLCFCGGGSASDAPST